MMAKSYLSLALALVVASHQASAFTSLLQQPQVAQPNTQNEAMSTALFMGRAAAVRAATKSKTDAKKAKTNAVFGKKIIMAVKAGGSPDPVANRQLGEIIKQAKANSVPVDVSIGEREQSDFLIRMFWTTIGSSNARSLSANHDSLLIPIKMFMTLCIFLNPVISTAPRSLFIQKYIHLEYQPCN